MSKVKLERILIISGIVLYIIIVLLIRIKKPESIDNNGENGLEIVETISADDNVFMEGGENLSYNWISNYSKLDEVGCPIWGIKLLGNYADAYFTSQGCNSNELQITDVGTNKVNYTASVIAVNKNISATFIYNIANREWSVEM